MDLFQSIFCGIGSEASSGSIAPTNLFLVPSSGNGESLDVFWTNHSSDYANLIVQMSLSSSFSNPQQDGVEPTTAEEFLAYQGLSGGSPPGIYYFRIAAQLADDSYLYSNTATYQVL
jgi:hypothetical protein